jgi:hypothetical protein
MARDEYQYEWEAADPLRSDSRAGLTARHQAASHVLHIRFA